jgi:hypothetical protein
VIGEVREWCAVRVDSVSDSGSWVADERGINVEAWDLDSVSRDVVNREVTREIA